MAKLMHKEEIEEKCGECGNLAIRVSVTYQNGSFGSCLECSICGNKDVLVSF